MQAKHVERQFNNFVQVFITLLVAAIVHNNYQQVALASIYVASIYMHYGSYRRANKYLYKFVDRPFNMFDLHAFFTSYKSSISSYTPVS